MERTVVRKDQHLDKWFVHFHSDLNGGYGHIGYADWASAWSRAVLIEMEKPAL
jgi:hypothetical protein